jgi:hypothetical protein
MWADVFSTTFILSFSPFFAHLLSTPSSLQIPQPAVWSEEGTRYTNALVGMLSDDLGWE